MTTAQDLSDYFYKGETATITLLAKNPNGSVISNPTDQTIIITIGSSLNSDPILQFNDRFVLEDVPTGNFSISLSDADMDSLVEGKVYFYNLWSKYLTADPRLQTYGKFVLQRSIKPSS